MKTLFTVALLAISLPACMDARPRGRIQAPSTLATTHWITLVPAVTPTPGTATAATTEPLGSVDTSVRTWFCMTNFGVYDDTACGRSLEECKEVAKQRAKAYKRYDVAFEPSACTRAASPPYCFGFQDNDVSVCRFRCFSSKERCERGHANLTATNVPMTECGVQASTFLDGLVNQCGVEPFLE